MGSIISFFAILDYSRKQDKTPAYEIVLN